MDLSASKLTRLVQSRKFWALVMGLASLAIGVATSHLTYDQAILPGIGMLSAYCLGTAVEDHGIAVGLGTAAQGQVPAAPPLELPHI